MPHFLHLDLSRNRSQFLAAMHEEDFRNLRPHMQVLTYEVGAVLYTTGDPATYVYFPLDACISIVTTVQEGKDIEVALVGSEGLVGIWAALGSETQWHESAVQVPGECVRMKADAFRAELKRSGALLDRLHRYVHYLMVQISQTAACNRLHRLEQRLARWLLMTRDCTKSDEFVATHEFLSRMLGSDRSEVTLTAGTLRNAGVIDYGRGRVKILDGQGLEKVSCECYGIFAEEARRLRRNGNR